MSDLPVGDEVFTAEDLLTQQQVADLFGYRPARVRYWMRGKFGPKKTDDRIPPLPYVRIGKTPYYSRRQIAWWLRQLQGEVDVAMVDVKRAQREQGT